MRIENTNIEIIRGDIAKLDVDLVVPPIAEKSPDEKCVRDHCRRFLQEAEAKAAGSIAFPALGCAAGGLPAAGAARIISQELLRHLRKETSLREIILCLPDEETFRTFEQTVRGYVDHIQDTLGKGPYVTVDAIIEVGVGGIILIERSNPPYGWALPGGFVDCGESLEQAVAREVKEETGLDFIDVRQFHAYSDPERDPRFHTISTVFIGEGKGTPKSGSDARGLQVVAYADLLNREYAFDHKKVIKDYLAARK